MHFPFLVADPYSGLRYRLTDTELAERSLAPRAVEWSPGRVIAEAPHPVWAESLSNAPIETISAICTALEDLILATPDLRPPTAEALPEGRAKRHLEALIDLWAQIGDALPEGLAPVRHVLDLPHGRFLDPLPVVEGSLDPHAPACMRALFTRLKAEFGAVPEASAEASAKPGTRLHALQAGLANPKIAAGPQDDSIAFYGLRDPAACADFAAARARALIEGGVRPRDIAVLAGGDPRQIARAFAAQGIPVSGLPGSPPKRDVIGETALHLALAKRPPTPAMVLAGIALSPLMPWTAETGRDLAESLMAGDFGSRILEDTPTHKDLWDDIRNAAGSLAQLNFLMDRICAHISEGDRVRARLPIPPGDGPLDWEAILRGIQVSQATLSDPVRNLEGVSLWSAHESPWRSCLHLIVTDFTDGLYPTRPHANPLFLDSEIDKIHAATGLSLRGRAAGLAHGLSLFDRQLAEVSENVTFLIPYRDLSGARLQPAAGLSLVARAVAGVEDAADLIVDISATPTAQWPVAYHHPTILPEAVATPEALIFPGMDLLSLRKEKDGSAKPQTPSRLERLLVSPLAWLLDEMDAGDMSWSAEALDHMAKGNIAHDVFEHVFPTGDALPDRESLADAVEACFERSLARNANFLRSAAWEMEREGLKRDILQAAERWLDYLHALKAKIVGNEIWLAGKVHGINLRGKADTILALPDGKLLVVDHKKSRTGRRRERMEAGWDLQVGLYRDMIAKPTRHDGDEMGPLIGRDVGIAYHLMNDGGFLCSGVNLPEGLPAVDMGEAINTEANNHLTGRLKDLRSHRVTLNHEADIKFYENEAKSKPFVLIEGSPLVTAFILADEEK